MMKVNNNIVISVGQAGNQIAATFWAALCQEHGIDPTSGKATNADAKGDWGAFFSHFGEGDGASFVPRAILVDLEPAVLEQVARSTGSLFHPSNILHGVEAAGGNFADGFAGKGEPMVAPTMQRLAAEAQKCDQLGAVFVFHSLGGGSGSGLGCRLIQQIKEEYPDVPVLSAAVFPSPKVSSVVTEPYNTVFALSILQRCADACIVFDNEALFAIAHDSWGIESPTVADLNRLITEVLTGLTAPMRFSGFLTVEISVRELITNLVPRPQLHFLLAGASPLTPPSQSKFEEMRIGDMIDQVFSKESCFAACTPLDGAFMSTALLYRGALDDRSEADAALAAMKSRLPLVPWIPTAFKIGYVEEPGLDHRTSVALITNNTEIVRVIERICDNFDKLWSRKAFANWYFAEGMTEEEIAGHRENVGRLIAAYRAAEEGAAPRQLAPAPEPGIAPLAEEPKAADDTIVESPEVSPGDQGQPIRLRDLVDRDRP